MLSWRTERCTPLLPIQHKMNSLPRARRRWLAVRTIARAAMAALTTTLGWALRHGIPAEQRRVARLVRRERQTQLLRSRSLDARSPGRREIPRPQTLVGWLRPNLAL